MANELRVSYNTAGEENVTATVRTSDGTLRAAGVSLTDSGHDNLYMGDYAVNHGDEVMYYRGTDVIAPETVKMDDPGNSFYG